MSNAMEKGEYIDKTIRVETPHKWHRDDGLCDWHHTLEVYVAGWDKLVDHSDHHPHKLSCN